MSEDRVSRSLENARREISSLREKVASLTTDLERHRDRANRLELELIAWRKANLGLDKPEILGLMGRIEELERQLEHAQDKRCS